MPSPLDYQSAGIDYGPLDAFKRLCQQYAASTATALAAAGAAELASSRGDSAYLVELPDQFIAHVEEGLGTKNLVADAVYKSSGKSFYANIGIDLVATIVNDLITCGARPLVLAMHAAAGDAAYFADGKRAADLAAGFAKGCQLAGAVWGGGETPALPGIVDPQTLVLAGSAVGQIKPKSRRIAGAIQDGDAIILLASSGIHTNGLTLCRALAERLPKGYDQPLPDGRPFGQALLDPSVIYANFMNACADAAVQIRYAVHLTGHGWRKLMRAAEPFVYRINNPGTAQPIFSFIAEHAAMDAKQMYATFNMGAGFAVIVRPADAAKCLTLAQSTGHTAWQGGVVVAQGRAKAVELVPLKIRFEESSLQLR
jgi:phosphoribosylformylglycinamidine cyclo-ligase